MTNHEIYVVYKWTAKPGKEDLLKKIYQDVEQQMKTNEPDALQVQCYFDDSSKDLLVFDHFKNGEALGLHLSTTAANHFSELLNIATPGPFLFLGEVPIELQKAAIGMGLNATFAPQMFGFKR